MTEPNFEAAYDRLFKLLEVRSQKELSTKLGVRPSSVSDAYRRRVIPDSWKMTLLRKFGINPVWVERGTGRPYLLDKDNEILLPSLTIKIGDLPTSDLMVEILNRFPAGYLLSLQRKI